MNKYEKYPAQVIAIVMSVIGLVAIFFALTTSLDIPDVLISHSTNECVSVINYTDEDIYSCENMPTKYNKIWVK
jgi:hypothetical protein|tara:strand:- start:278 stop:499 length:222 start_codon:yes stop_codon:yes gene_type:complete